MRIPSNTSRYLKKCGITALEFENSLSQCQRILERNIPNLVAEPLGPKYSTMAFDECKYNLLVSRLKKKFEVPKEANAEERRKRSIQSMLDYDNKGLKTFEGHRDIKTSMSKWVLYRARAALDEAFHSFRIDYTNFTFPSNRVSYNLGDDVSLEEKLTNKNCWEVTFACVDMFCRIAYANLYLKRIAKKHIGCVTKHERQALYEKYKQFKDCGYRIFKALLLKYVLIIVAGGRVSTVPKNNEVDRVIIVEPLCNMVCQRCIALNLIKCANLTDYFAINLVDGQELHKMMISDYQNATIDFANASNSVYTSVIKWLWPKSVVNKLLAARSEHVVVDSEYVPLTMLSAMGNGFTFEVMTLTLLAIARVLDTGSMVYGDDVIIDCDVADTFIETCTQIGFNTNTTKTFLSGDFRESCGGFISHGTYLKSFDFEYPTCWFDLVVCINKLRIISNELDDPGLKEVYKQLLSHTPVVAWSAAPEDQNLLEGSIFVDAKYLNRKRKGDEVSRKAHKSRSQNVIVHYITDLQYKNEPYPIFKVTRKSRSSRNEYDEFTLLTCSLFEPGSNGCKSRIYLDLPWLPSSSTDGVDTTQTVDTLQIVYDVLA